ncbi:sensor histidine kinase [Motilimonas eburnea]|uniref:sensor histidine kinase n=1 Tax=Motilimonas eburnea TaxID=1737488 RepID=UPI002551EB0C|nr:ATP-binding protein [Motilimonas eburnea]
MTVTELPLEKEQFAGELAMLRAQHCSLASVFDLLPSGVILLDNNGRVTQANPVAIELLGDPLVGELWFNIIRRAFAPQADDGHEVSLANGKKIQLSISPLEGFSGQLISLTDLTHTRELQDKMAQMKRLSALGNMVASLAHQIRTPLSAAMLYAANLGSVNLPETSRTSFQAKLMSRLQDLETQVTDMLLFARSGEKQVVAEVSLQSLLQEVKQGSDAMMQRANASLTIALPDPDLFLLANKNALASAIGNLIHNALQACGDGAKIHLRATCNTQSQVEISVLDNGPGIPAALLPEIVQPFYTTKPQGTGLGLAVVQSVAKAHEGEMHVNSVVGKGSCFTLCLPLHAVAPMPAQVVGG